MIGFIFWLFFICICLACGFFISNYPGEVTIVLADYSVRLNFVSWLLISLAVALIIIYGLRLIIFLARSGKIRQNHLHKKWQKQLDKNYRKGTNELNQGHYAKAEKYLVRAAQYAIKKGDDPALYFSHAARAADQQGGDWRRDEYLIKARQYGSDKQSLFTAKMATAEVNLENGKFAQAQELLEALHLEEPRNQKVLLLLDRAYHEQEKWQDAWTLLYKLKPFLAEDEFQKKQTHYAQLMLRDTAAVESFNALEEQWKKLPKDIRRDPAMIIEYSTALVQNNHPEEAEKLLALEINKTHDETLLQAYGQLPRGNFERQLKNMLKWESFYQNPALFYFVKAQIAYKAQDFETANEAIQKSINAAPKRSAFALWGMIQEARNQPAAALIAYRCGISQSEGAISGEIIPLLSDHSAQTAAVESSEKNSEADEILREIKDQEKEPTEENIETIHAEIVEENAAHPDTSKQV